MNTLTAVTNTIKMGAKSFENDACKSISSHDCNQSKRDNFCKRQRKHHQCTINLCNENLKLKGWETIRAYNCLEIVLQNNIANIS